MYKNIKVEAEHNELILENTHGDKVIIPANKRNWVKQKLSEGCHNCIDSLVETLPIASQYAQDGSVYPPNTKVKVNQNNQIKEYDISSPEYKDLYNSGHLASYDAKTNTYYATPLKEVTVTAEAPQWLKDKRNLEKQYNKDWYINNQLPKFSRAMGISSDNMGGNQKGYDEYINNKVAESILKRNPNFDKDYENDRLKTLSNYSQKELEIIKNSNLSYKIEPSIWSKFEQGLLSVGNAGSPVTFKNENLTKEEAKKEDNPLNILQPLSIPSKMVQSAYKKDYSFKDALKGKQNNANIGEDIVTDPLNLVGLGIWSKLSKANKFRNLEEAYQSIKGLSKEEGLSKLGSLTAEDFKNPKYQELDRWFTENIRFKNLPKTQHKSAIQTLEDFKLRINSPEGQKRMKDLGITEQNVLDDLKILEDNTNYGYYKPNTSKIALHKDLPDASQTTRHEIEHAIQDALQQSKMKQVVNGTTEQRLEVLNNSKTDIDKMLEGLELRKEAKNNKFVSRTGKKDIDLSDYDYKLSNKQNAIDYFTHGSEGREKSAFLAEVQQYMLDNKYLKSAYDKVTPKKVKEVMVDAMFDEKNRGKYLRLFNIIKANDKNYNLISDGLNKMLGVSPFMYLYLQNQQNNKEK